MGVFNSWDDLEAAFESYQSDTFQMYKLRTSNSIKDRNRSRSKQATKRGSEPALWDESLGYYTKTWNCTH
ncbi:hypothetical protein L917_12480 [Phytophthora nicotianae]|nr:hypothetical protein L917_12480 [Phytophthora nicotianae]